MADKPFFHSLFAESTTACIAVGWELTFEGASIPTTQLRSVLRAARDLGLGLDALVPGDTATTRPDDFENTAVVGRVVYRTENYAPAPTPVDLDAVRAALRALPAPSQAQWTTLKAAAPALAGAAWTKPRAWLLSWGPLCYGALHVGRPLSAAQRDAAKYKLATNQDMDQEASAGGVDGVHTAVVEFSDWT